MSATICQNGHNSMKLDAMRRHYGAQHHAEDQLNKPQPLPQRASAQAKSANVQAKPAISGIADFAGQKTLSCHRIDGTDRPALQRARKRLMLAGTAFACAMAIIAGRLVDVALTKNEEGNHIASPLHGDFRADIVDRNGVLMATQVQTASLFADPAKVLDPADTAAQLVRVLPDLNAERLTKRLSSDGRFTWIKRHLTPEQHAAVHRLGLPGIDTREETRRFYPQGNSFSHLLGFTSIDNEGLAGIEQEFDTRLTSESEPLKLSVDTRVQDILRRNLGDAMLKHQAVGATGLVMDARTGEVVAMASLPDYDPMRPAEAPADHRFNRAVQGVYELGSTFKIFTSAMALNSGRITMRDGVDTTDPIRVGRFTISDFHPQSRWLSVPEIFMYSSNIGTARLAMAVGTEGQQKFLNNLGLTQRLSVELPEAANPIVPKTWRDVSTMTISYGHGIAVTPMHLTSAVSAMVNGGVWNAPTILAANSPDNTHKLPSHRVISEQTSAQVRQLMRLVVEHGTGGRADADGYLVGGKTGTAEKAVNGRYAERSLISSFVAAFPMNDPKYVVLATLDEPKGTKDTYGYATGGWVAAPVVSQVIAEMAPILGLPRVNADDPKVRRALDIRFDGPVIENEPEPTPFRGTRLASY